MQVRSPESASLVRSASLLPQRVQYYSKFDMYHPQTFIYVSHTHRCVTKPWEILLTCF